MWRGITGSWSGGKNFAFLSTQWMGAVMAPKLRIWLTSKLWPSACQPPKRKYMAPWLPNPVWQCWEERGNLGPKTPRMTQDYWEVQKEETVMLAIILQQCTIWAGAPQTYSVEQYKSSTNAWLQWWRRVTCSIWRKRYRRGLGRTPWLPLPWQEPPHWKEFLHRCLEWKSLPTFLHLILHPCMNQKVWHLMRTWPRSQGSGHSTPRISPQDLDNLAMVPLEDAHQPRGMTLLDLSTLESLEITISHNPAMGKVHYHLQAQSFTRMSLLSTSSQGQLKLSPKVKEPWVIIMLLYIMETPVLSIDLSEYSLCEWGELQNWVNTHS